MLVREEMNRQDELKRIKKRNREEKAKGRTVNKKAEEGPLENAVVVQGMDRQYKEILSSSPLKLRRDYDLTGIPVPSKEKSEQKKSAANLHISHMSRVAKTPAKKS